MSNSLLRNLIIPCNDPDCVLIYNHEDSFEKASRDAPAVKELSKKIETRTKSFFEEYVKNWFIPASHLTFGARSIYTARGVGPANPWLGSLRMFEGVVLVADGWLSIWNGVGEFPRALQAKDWTGVCESLVHMGVGVASIVSGIISIVVTAILLAMRTMVAASFFLVKMLYGVSVVVALVQLTRIVNYANHLFEITQFSHELERTARADPLKALTSLRERYLVLNWSELEAREVADEFYRKSRELSELVSDSALCDEICYSAGVDDNRAKEILDKIFLNTTKHRVEEFLRLLFSIAHLVVNLLALVGGPLVTMTYAIVYASCSAFLWILVDMEKLRNVISNAITALLLDRGLVYQTQEPKKIAPIVLPPERHPPFSF